MPDADDAPEGFEWDADKASANLEKHGVSFHEAAKVWADSRRFVRTDLKHSIEEPRFFIVGQVERTVLTVRYTVRGDRNRIIGAGAWRRGRRAYVGQG